MSQPPSFPDDATIDLHDLAAIFMYERMLHESTFSHFRLVGFNDGEPIPELANDPREDWDVQPDEGRPEKKIIELERDEKYRAGDLWVPRSSIRDARKSVVTPESFEMSPNTALSTGLSAPLPFPIRELLYWRCKNFDNGYALVYGMQRVLDQLPTSTKLAVRMKNKAQNTIISNPRTFSIVEMDVRAHQLVAIIRAVRIPGTTRAAMSQHNIGSNRGYMPWCHLLLGKATSVDLDKDTRVVLDLACTMLGARGPCGELFALERTEDYLNKTLASVADDLGGEIKLSGRTIHSKEDRPELDRLADAVLERIRMVVVDGDSFCGHCGSPTATMRCSICKKSYFCSRDHQLAGWKFHKLYCKA